MATQTVNASELSVQQLDRFKTQLEEVRETVFNFVHFYRVAIGVAGSVHVSGSDENGPK